MAPGKCYAFTEVEVGERTYSITTFEVTWNLNRRAVYFKLLPGTLVAHGP
jgi:hypothetical protein